jgi:hypothetical protein
MIVLVTYAVSVRVPSSHSDSDVALPQIRIHLHSPTGALNFLGPLRAKYVAPFRTHAVLAVTRLTHPSSHVSFVRLPSCCRWHLNVYKRPEPKPVSWSVPPSHSSALAKGGRIGWQQPTTLERASRQSVNAFLARRAHAQHFDTGTDVEDGKLRELVISYLFFFEMLPFAAVTRQEACC